MKLFLAGLQQEKIKPCQLIVSFVSNLISFLSFLLRQDMKEKNSVTQLKTQQKGDI